MLQSMVRLHGRKLDAKDGMIGKLTSFYFDDRWWTVRYLVVDTGRWLFSRKVLISPVHVAPLSWESDTIPVALTKNQVKNAPFYKTDRPVSRQYEAEYHRYYRLPPYWDYPGVWGFGQPPVDTATLSLAEEPYSETEGDPNLRSSEDVIGYGVHAEDGEVGVVTDFIFDDSNWTIRYAVIDTGVWLPGKKVLIAPDWIANVRWSDRIVEADLPKELIQTSPEYDPDVPPPRIYETALYEHYSRHGYWQPEQDQAAGREVGADEQFH